MIFSTIDQIVRRGLLESGLPIHYYAELLFHSSTCLRELSFDSLKIINTVHLPINDYGAVDLPVDFVDDVSVCFKSADLLKPIPKKDSINPLRLFDTETDNFISYPNSNQQNANGTQNLFFWGGVGWFWYWNVSDYGEPTGKYYGANGGSSIGYKVIKERRQIQLSGIGKSGGIILMYISDGQSIDNASQIDTQAFQTIRAWQEWKRSPNANNQDSPEARSFDKQKRLLRARMNDLTLTDIKDIIRRNYTAAIKN